MSWTIEMRLPTRALRRLDLPTLGRPTMAMVGMVLMPSFDGGRGDLAIRGSTGRFASVFEHEMRWGRSEGASGGGVELRDCRICSTYGATVICNWLCWLGLSGSGRCTGAVAGEG